MAKLDYPSITRLLLEGPDQLSECILQKREVAELRVPDERLEAKCRSLHWNSIDISDHIHFISIQILRETVNFILRDYLGIFAKHRTLFFESF